MMNQGPGSRPSAGVVLSGIRKTYDEVTALADLSLDIDEGEFVTLLGPSGCGKTTLLRIIAGFLSPDRGSVIVGRTDITRTPPHRRPVNTVFQRPILLPHLDVFQNVAFGLRARKVPQAQVEKKVREILDVVRLPGFETRRADELSGGQAQRVSLARALVNEPRLLLLDEPLASLDLRVRLDMQTELKRIHRETGIIFLYVTHDQQEAMAMSDRVAVLESGQIRQLGTPEEVYGAPLSRFVARFVGDANVIAATTSKSEGGRARVKLEGTDVHMDVTDVPAGGGRGWVSVRPESLRLAPPGNGQLHGAVTDTSFLGAVLLLRVDIAGHEVRVATAASGSSCPRVGDLIGLTYDPDRVRFLTS